jgi:hypothetical protein
LYSLSSRVRPITGGWEPVGANIAGFDVPADGDPRFSHFLPTPTAVTGAASWNSGVSTIRWAATSTSLGASVAATDGWTCHDVYVARVRLRDLGSVTRWRYFASGSWTDVQADATPILRSSINDGAETLFSVWKAIRLEDHLVGGAPTGLVVVTVERRQP